MINNKLAINIAVSVFLYLAQLLLMPPSQPRNASGTNMHTQINRHTSITGINRELSASLCRAVPCSQVVFRRLLLINNRNLQKSLPPLRGGTGTKTRLQTRKKKRLELTTPTRADDDNNSFVLFPESFVESYFHTLSFPVNLKDKCTTCNDIIYSLTEYLNFNLKSNPVHKRPY